MSRFESAAPPSTPAEPAFAEPWQATAFALVVHLHARGVFTWQEWTKSLSGEIARDTRRPYYEHWLAALEGLVREKGLSDQRTLDGLKENWADAYRHTPHGKPVILPRRA